MKKTCIVIPTYNEHENLPVLVKKIFALGLPKLCVYVVDDNSPDGTGQVAEELARQYPVKIIHRPKKDGLGKAYTDAFRKILEEDECNYIIQMDADLSHDPNVIPEMLKYVETHDIIVGSRYVSGGAIEHWSLLRRLLSTGGNIYARTILRVPHCDVTSGFKCYRRAVLIELVRDSFDSVGYNFQIEILYKAHTLGYTILEIPIVFTERSVGSSKINIFIIVESFYKVLLLRLSKLASRVRNNSRGY